MMRERIEQIDRENSKYEEELYQEQAEYKKNFDAIERHIFAFHQNSNINIHETTVKMCEEVMAKLTTFTEQTRKFNSR